jgi:hypothetical protein
VVFELPGASLTATLQPARKSHRLHASLLAVVKDANGQVEGVRCSRSARPEFRPVGCPPATTPSKAWCSTVKRTVPAPAQ